MRTALPSNTYVFAYNAQNSYYHAAFAHAYGAGLLDDTGRYLFDGPDAARSVRLVQRLLRDRVSPEEADGTAPLPGGSWRVSTSGFAPGVDSSD